MSVIWRKIGRDLLSNFSRTALVVMSTAVGVFALGLVFGVSAIMRECMTEDHQRRTPGHINYFRVDAFDQNVVDAIRREPGVLDAEGQTHLLVHWRLEGETEWRNANLVARDYEDQHTDLIDLVEGRWPSGRALGVERQTAQFYEIPLGGNVIVERGRREMRLPIAGIVRMPMGFFSPPQVGGEATFFATSETVEWLTGYRGFNQLNVRLESFSQSGAEELASRIEKQLNRLGLSVGSYAITDPAVHWLQPQADAVFLILGVLGFLSLGLSAFLIINTTQAIMARQIWQIGVMKVVGATPDRVVGAYLIPALAYGLAALIIAVPLGAWAAHELAVWLLDLLGIAGGPFRIAPAAIGVQVAVGLVVPVLAALGPVMGGARITPHQAISRYGLSAGFGQSWLDRWVGRIGILPRLMALSLRNVFRSKGRVILTLAALVLGGVMFVAVMSAGRSLDRTLEAMAAEFGFDALVVLEQPERIGKLVRAAESIEGVRAEVWDYRSPTLILPGRAIQALPLWGVPVDSALFTPRLVAGRGFLPGDRRVLLLNNRVAANEGVHVGDTVTLSFGGRESSWTVVGLVLSFSGYQHDSFAPFDAMASALGNADQGTMVAVAAEGGAGATLPEALAQVYERRRLDIRLLRDIEQLKEQNRIQFEILIYLLLCMSVLAAAVGGIGLAGVMSINVVERRREIGVMRAVGASSQAVVGVFIGEGLFLGMLSWLLAVPISVPAAVAFSQAVGQALFRFPLEFDYSFGGALLWLLLVAALSCLTSLWPALQAARVSVREALAYE